MAKFDTGQLGISSSTLNEHFVFGVGPVEPPDSKFEVLADVYATSTLDGDIDSSQTTIDVLDASGYPDDGQFRVRVAGEIMLVHGVIDNSLFVTRAVEDTVAAAASSGTTVKGVLTAAGMRRHLQDNIPHFGSTDRIPFGFNEDNSEFDQSDFSTSGSGLTKSAITNGGMHLEVEEDADNANGPAIAYKSIPVSATVVRIQCCFTVTTPSDTATETSGPSTRTINPLHGIGVRDSTNGDVLYLNLDSGTTWVIHEHSAWNTFTSEEESVIWSNGLYKWVRIDVDDDAATFYVSTDGITWIEIWASPDAHFTGDVDELLFLLDPDECEFVTHMNILALDIETL